MLCADVFSLNVVSNCGQELHADINAEYNILYEAMRKVVQRRLWHGSNKPKTVQGTIQGAKKRHE